MPIISDKIPGPCRNLKAGDIMNPYPKTLQTLDTVEHVGEIITSANHHAFPLVNRNDKLVGLIPRNFIIVMLLHNGFYGTDELIMDDVKDDLNASSRSTSIILEKNQKLERSNK